MTIQIIAILITFFSIVVRGASSGGAASSSSMMSTRMAKGTTSAAAAATATATRRRKTDAIYLTIVRHGQAQHNPRAEHAKANGCTHDEFIRLMREDDALDADLTEVGRDQARRAHQLHFASHSTAYDGPTPSFDYVVSSPLSRAIDTADLIYPVSSSDTLDEEANTRIESTPAPTPTKPPRRVCLEAFREINGNLLNGKRRTKTELRQKFPHWDFGLLKSHHDDTWTEEMEPLEDAAERGYQGLCWLLQLSSSSSPASSSSSSSSSSSLPSILLVSHGGLLRYTMNEHPLVHLADERSKVHHDNSDSKQYYKSVGSRFDNCEVRHYRLSWKEGSSSDTTVCDGERINGQHDGNEQNVLQERNHILLTQIDP